LDSIESTGETPVRRLLLFGVAGRLCACDLAAVREIIPARAATRMPGAPAWVRGLINLRGTLVTVVDLAVRFDAGAGGVRTIIVAEAAGKALGIGVDEVRDVQSVAESAVEAVDAQRAAGGIVLGLAHVTGARAQTETALVVDVAEVVRQALVL
jgi:purine-binding chemotaxis protein CheW